MLAASARLGKPAHSDKRSRRADIAGPGLASQHANPMTSLLPISQPAWTRRRLLQASAGGLLGGFLVGAQAARLVGAAALQPAADTVELTAWVRISLGSRTVALVLSQAEIGQGISTTLPAVLADELGLDWAAVQLLTAPRRPEFKNPKYQWMFTGNSESIQGFYELVRRMGAAAREMLVQAAAARWGVPAADCDTENSEVVHAASGRRLHVAEVAEAAARLPVPAEPKLREPGRQRLVGRALPRVDVPAKVDGSAIFGIDFAVPGMLVAAVRTMPLFGGELLPVDTRRAAREPGVKAVLPMPDGVAVVAQRYWQARRALEHIELKARPTPASASVDSALIEAGYQRALAGGPFATVVDEGGAVAGETFEADYFNGFAAHATLEPMNCVAHVTADRCVIWAPTQGQDLAAAALQAVLGLPPERVEVNRTPYIGGGFGRRLLPDFIVQAALISKAVGAPVKLIWSREEDMRRDAFRPASALRLKATLADDGLPLALHARLVSPTILGPVFPPIQKMLDEQHVDPSALEGLERPPYRFEARRVDFHLARLAVPTSVMRTTGFGPNLFALESFIDELALKAGSDGLALRRRLLTHRPDALAVLERAAALADWGQALPAGQGRGLAFTEAFGSLLATVVDVRVKGDAVKVLRIVSVLDCGRVLDPGIARANLEGGAVFGLAYAKAEVSFEQGRLRQDNFGAYTLPYLAETPPIVVDFVTSGRPLGGVAEIGPVTIPPALANAIHAASGRRLRAMPIGRDGLFFE